MDLIRLYSHDVLMEEAGLIKASFIKDIDGIVRTCIVLRLTKAGHDFLEASRSETIWKKYKEKTAKVGGGLMMAVATELLKKLVKDQLGILRSFFKTKRSEVVSTRCRQATVGSTFTAWKAKLPERTSPR